MPLRRIIYMAINNGWLQRDPFYGYSITKEETKRGFLTKEEITLLINGTFKKKSYELIRDLFIFCIFTGLSWTDMYHLTKKIWKSLLMVICGLRPNARKRVQKVTSVCWKLPNISLRNTKVWRKTASCCPSLVTPTAKTNQSNRKTLWHREKCHVA